MPSENPNDASSSVKAGASSSEGGLADSAFKGAETSVGIPAPSTGDVPPEYWVGRSLGKYQVTGVLGKGAMGVVLKAHDPTIDRDVAIKILAEHLATNATALGRFLAEARAAGKLNHANVMAIYEICEEGTTHYLVLEFVAGGSLEDRLDARRSLPVLEATQAVIDACRGVGAAHSTGLVHRDIKPANLMRASDGSIKVADFGLARGAADSNRQLTQAGMVVGTPAFMSPEQCEAKPVDHRSDLYSLGATYYCLLTGAGPFQDSETVPQLMYAHCHKPPPDPREVDPTLPEACHHIIARAMAKVPGERYQSAAEMIADLEAVIASLSGQTRVPLPSASGTVPAVRGGAPAWRMPAVGGGLVAVLLIALLLVWRPWQNVAVVVPAAGEPILVGVLHSLSGTMASSEAPVVDAVLFAIEEVNHAGGVLGRPVKAVVADGRSDALIFAREAERLIVKEKVCTVFGCWTSATRKTVKPVFEEHDHLLVYPVQFEGLETSPCIFYLGAAPNQQILPAVKWAMTSLHRKKFFLVGSDYVFPRAAHAIIKDQLKQSGGEVVGEQFVPLGSQRVDDAVSAIAKAKPDVILNTINGDSNVAFFRGLRAAGIKAADTPTISFSIGEQGLRALNPADLAGDYAAWTYFQAVATPENEDFVRRFLEKHPQQCITDPMETAYIGVKLWAMAANEAQSLDPKKIRRALLNQRTKGPGGDIRINAETQYSTRTPRIGQIQADGSFKIAWTAPEPVRPDPYPNSRTPEAWRNFLQDMYVGWGNRWEAPQGHGDGEKAPR
jgi:urea transport system substrate-binding protein